jgi:tetratricopeptide (TPR) repeat protein
MYSADDFVERLCACANTQDRPVIFLVGSALSAPDTAAATGIPTADGIVERIRDAFDEESARRELDSHLGENATSRYQNAFEFLIGRRGQDAANQIVRRAVCCAREPRVDSSLIAHLDADTCRRLEDDYTRWGLPRAMDALTNLITGSRDVFGRTVLTTNFDPLIEIGIRQRAGEFYRTVLHQDGNLGQTVGTGTHIVHLHGYWQGYDTLHTPAQLHQARPQLKASLARLIEASTLVVLGYGGWDDYLTRAVVEVLADSTSNPELLWAFHSSDEDAITATNSQLMEILSPGLGRGRVALYKGIDACSALMRTQERLESAYPQAAITTRVTEVGSARSWSQPRQVRIEISVPIPADDLIETDIPPSTDAWVGREQEFKLLDESTQQVAFITGIGGQGKSLLAAQFVKTRAAAIGLWWDWRDCREESDRLATQILRAVERLSAGTLQAQQIDTKDIRAVVAVLFRALGTRPALLVFDNVDQYIDLESLRPVKGLDVLVAMANTRSQSARFIFTCRPEVRLSDDRGLVISLGGLSPAETHDLLVARGLPQEGVVLHGDLQRLTNGHPLWTNLVAMQSLRHAKGLAAILDGIKKGGGGLPETTRSIWNTLDEAQRRVLCTMAELDRPEPESRLLDFLPGQNANRVGRSLRALKSLHLVEIKHVSGGESHLDLHPIIRQFIRTEFPKREREKFVGSILVFLDRMIGRFKGLLISTPSYEVLEHWTRKADYQISFGRFEAAIATIEEIRVPLQDRGHSEEFVRICARLFAECDWVEAMSYKGFDAVVQDAVTSTVERGQDSVAREWLEKYRAAIPGKSATYIRYCDLVCYADWFGGNFESAVLWGEEGQRLKEVNSVDTSFSCEHNLALARRDSGRVTEALSYFLGAEDLGVVATPGVAILEKGAQFYGNVGRCLQLLDRHDEAVACCRKSSQLLESETGSAVLLNRGYARFWIGETLLKAGQAKAAAMCFRAAADAWEDCAPPRAENALAALKEVVENNQQCEAYLSSASRVVQAEYLRWLQGDLG